MFCTHRFNFVGIAAFILILLNQSAFAADAEVDAAILLSLHVRVNLTAINI
ncbi:Uncharacterised protein [Kingella kingae]|nr:Uncharacterised protein [Kingella kingae]